MKYISIEIDANKVYLVYNRGLIREYALISKTTNRSSFDSPLKDAFYNLKQSVRWIRGEMRDGDKLKEKGKESIVRLLKNKRRHFAHQCLVSKSPTCKVRHVGVEIEFISSSKRAAIAEDLAFYNLQNYVELKSDGSVSGSGETDCDGSCRDECNCADCGDMHYCDDSVSCNRRARNHGGDGWAINDDCRECEETEELEGCNCGGTSDDGQAICLGEHIVCVGHCPGHYCNGYDDHDDYECQCECTCNANYGHEIAIVAKSTEINAIVKKVCHVLAKHNSEVNNTCGLHVHLDARNRKHDKMFHNLVNAQRLLYSMVPKSRYNNSYCKPNTFGRSMSEYCDRYYGVNPKSYGFHKTIEIRLHSGTINASKICNWIELISKIAYARPLIGKINSLRELTAKVKLSESLLTYVKERIGKFASDHGGYSLPIDETETNPLAVDIAQYDWVLNETSTSTSNSVAIAA